jgi:PAS domain S-box-containing protein
MFSLYHSYFLGFMPQEVTLNAPSILGRNIRQWRTKRALTQSALAQQAGISHATISRLESGKVREIRSASLSAIASVLDVPVDALITSSPSSTPDAVHPLSAIMQRIRLQAFTSFNLDQILDIFIGHLVMEEVFPNLAVALVRLEENCVEVVRNVTYPQKESRLPARDFAAGNWKLLRQRLSDDQENIGQKYSLDDNTLMAQVTRTGNLLVHDQRRRDLCPNSEEIDDVNEAGDSPEQETVFFVPIQWGHKVLALLKIISETDEKREIQRRIETLAPLFDELALVLEKTRRIRGMDFNAEEWLHSTIIPMLVHDQAKVVAVNQSFCELFGYNEDEIPHTDGPNLLIHPRYHSQLRQIVSQNPEHARLFLTGIRRDGSVFPMEAQSGPILWGDQSLRVVYVWNVERFQTEKARERLHRVALEIECVEDLSRFLRIFHGELMDLGLDPEGVGINLIDKQHSWYRRFSWVHNTHFFDSPIPPNRKWHDQEELVACWRRGEIYDRPFTEELRPLWDEFYPGLEKPYEPGRMIDVPFDKGTLGVTLPAGQDFYRLHDWLKQIAPLLSLRMDHPL